MAKYDVELITDKHGKPMPQYFDEQDGIMKPITKDNFDGTISGSVDVEFPDVQKVEVTNPADYPTELNVNVNNPVDTVSVDNLPDVQRVEVTNAQEQLDVNVLNPVDNVSVNNLPTDYPDQAVEARLQAIEQTQSQILDKLNDTIDTRLTGSIVEQEVNLKSSDLGKDNAIYTSTVEEHKLETLWDGRVLQPNETGTVVLNATNEKGIHLFISVDKPNWTLRGRTLFGRLNHETTFPSYNNHDKAYTSAEPALAFLLGIRPVTQGLENPTSLDEARALRMPIGNNEYVMLLNNNDEPSTFTVKVLRIW